MDKFLIVNDSWIKIFVYKLQLDATKRLTKKRLSEGVFMVKIPINGF